MKDDSFKEYIEHELLTEVDGITVKHMFSGFGVYRFGVCIGLISDGTLYLKVDPDNQKDFEREGSKPFVYTGHKGKSVTLSFWEAPASVSDNPREIVPWILSAYGAALRSKKKK